MKNTFSKSDIGASVVFAGFDGGSYSAKIVEFGGIGHPHQHRHVVIEYLAAPDRSIRAVVYRCSWNRLTRFPVGCSFLAV
jgi:hypothetical protein